MYCYYELKVAKGKKFWFSQIEDHQHDALPALQKEGLVWKLSDEDSRRKPCDGFSAPPLPAYLVVLYADTFYLILYAKIARMRATGRHSVDEDEAVRMADHVIHMGAI